MMMNARAVQRVLGIAGAFALVCTGAAHAQSAWQPSRNVEIVVGQGAGGGVDRTARMMQKILQERRIITVPVLVANRPGAGGAIAQNVIRESGGDGHQVLLISTTLLSNEITGASTQGYRDFSHLAYLYDEFVGFGVLADSKIGSVKELMGMLKARPESVAIGNATAMGNVNHVAAALLTKSVGGDPRKLRIAIFNSAGQSVQAVLGGHVDMIVAPVGNLIPHAKSGKMRVLAIAAPRRSEGALANVPTLTENGADVVLSAVRVVLGSRALKPEQIAYWEQAMASLSESPEWKQYVANVDGTLGYRNSRDLTAFLDSEYKRHFGVLSEVGLAKATR